MAPKASAEKKPAQPAKKAVAKKSTAGRKKGSKKAVESYKIYIYKVRLKAKLPTCILVKRIPDRFRLFSTSDVDAHSPNTCAGLEASPPRHWHLLQSNVNFELLHC